MNYEPERSRNIISNVTKPVPSETLVAWMAKQADDDLFISSLTVAEIRRGILEKPAGKRRRELERWFSGPEGPQALFAGRVLPFDEKASLIWARLMADGTAKGRPRSPLDMVIAAVGRQWPRFSLLKLTKLFWFAMPRYC